MSPLAHTLLYAVRYAHGRSLHPYEDVIEGVRQTWCRIDKESRRRWLALVEEQIPRDLGRMIENHHDSFPVTKEELEQELQDYLSLFRWCHANQMCRSPRRKNEHNRCGLCNTEGHNLRRCPQNKSISFHQVHDRLGKVMDVELAREFKVAPSTIGAWRRALGIAPFRGPRVRPSDPAITSLARRMNMTESKLVATLRKDARKAAKALGVSIVTVYAWRKRVGILVPRRERRRKP